MDNTEQTENKNRPSKQKFIYGIIAGALASVLILFIIFNIGIYRYGWGQSGFGNFVVKTLNLPAGYVNGNWVYLENYYEDVDTLKYYYSHIPEEPGLVLPEESDLKKSVLRRMVKDKIVEQLAKKYGISVSEEEVNNEYQKAVSQIIAGEEAESEEDVKRKIAEEYGWTPEQFKEKVLRTFVLESKLSEAVKNSEDFDERARSRAEEVLELVKSGEKSFEDLAREYSDGPSAQDGGNLEFFGKGVMVPEFEEAAFALEEGEVSGLVKTQFGYHIIKVEEKVVNEESGEVEQVKARHILITPQDFNEFLQDKLTTANVEILLPNYYWNANCLMILEEGKKCGDI